MQLNLFKQLNWINIDNPLRRVGIQVIIAEHGLFHEMKFPDNEISSVNYRPTSVIIQVVLQFTYSKNCSVNLTNRPFIEKVENTDYIT